MVNMAVHPIEYRYGSDEIRNVFDEEKKLEKMLLVEAARAVGRGDAPSTP